MRVKVKASWVDCYEEPELICPFCGHINPESWDLEDNCNGYTCPNCNRKFAFNSRVIRVFFFFSNG